MKQTSILATLLLALSTSGVTIAGNGPADRGAVRNDDNPVAQLRQLPDPATFADDICWVAPEWRDD